MTDTDCLACRFSRAFNVPKGEVIWHCRLMSCSFYLEIVKSERVNVIDCEDLIDRRSK